MNLRHSLAIFKKQVLDTIKNSGVLLQFILFPLLAFVLTKTVVAGNNALPDDYFIKMFSSMYIGMSPAVAIGGIIAEEKEKGCLRSLFMNTVKPTEYLLGVSLYVFIMCLIGSVILALGGNYSTDQFLAYFLIMALGIICSILLGATIGVVSSNQMAAHSMIIPITMVIAFLPLISMFNEKFKDFSKYLYSQQASDMMGRLDIQSMESMQIIIYGVNMLVLLICFVYFYKKKGMYSY